MRRGKISFFLPEITRLYLLFMFFAGITTVISSLSGLKARKLGTKSLTSAISNTALAFSTIFFVIFWKNTITVFGTVGIVLMLFSVFLMGHTGEGSSKANRIWLGLCICALLFNTVSIILTTIPSQYNMKDAVGLRGTAIFTFLALFYFVLKCCRHVQSNRNAIKIAAVNSILSAIVQMVSYPLLDTLAENKLAYVFTPIKLVTSLVFFAVITSIRFKEKPKKIQLIGIVLCVVGILLFMV